MIQYLGKSGGRHLHPAFIRRINLQIMSISAVQPQQPQTRTRTVVALAARVDAAKRFAQLLGLRFARRGQFAAPF